MYLVTLDNVEHGVELRETTRGVWNATRTDGTKVELELKGRDGNGHFVVRVNGIDRKVEVHRNGSLHFLENGNTHIFEIAHAADVVLDELSARQPDHLVDATLKSPITGIVLDIHVKLGDVVEAGQPIMVVEAMKMENTLGAPCDGTITAINNAAGDTVFVGDVMIELDHQ